MIKTDILVDGMLHIYSTEGKKIIMKDTGWIVRSGNAYEPADGKHHEYEEVEEELSD